MSRFDPATALSREGPRAQGRYLSAVRYGDVVVSAGMTPRDDGVLVYVGKVGRDLGLAEARAAAVIAATNALTAVVGVAGSADAVVRCVRLAVYVNSVDDFTEHSAVADAASERLEELLGERSRGARAAVGVASLPGGAPVEVELWCAVAAESRDGHTGPQFASYFAGDFAED